MSKLQPSLKKVRGRNHVYLVTSVLSNEKNVTSAPVLGVHTSLKSAKAHWESCVKCSSEYQGAKLCWTLGPTDLRDLAAQGHPRTDLYKAYISKENGAGTTLTIERW